MNARFFILTAGLLGWSLPVLQAADQSSTAGGLSPAVSQKRTLRLPAEPFDYESSALPLFAARDAKRFDNLPPSNPITNDGATLGRVLFYDTTLSRNGSTSCASCHDQSRAFAEGS